MGTEIANLPPMIRNYGQSLAPQAASMHRAWIGVRVEALLDGYWQSRPSEMVKEEILADWMATLDAFDRDEITCACREWLRDNPRAKPRPGDIAAIVQRDRAMALADWKAKQPTLELPKPAPVSKERAAEILKAAGFRVNKFGGAE